MPLGPFSLDSFAIDKATATAGTAYQTLIPPRKKKRTKLTFLQITCGGTAHTGTIMRELSRTTTAAAAASGATSLVLTRDPGKYASLPEWRNRGITPNTSDNAIAANDWIVVLYDDGTYAAMKPSAVATDSATGYVTLTVSALAGSIRAGQTVWFMGITTDTDPHTGKVHDAFAIAASATTVWPNAAAGGSVIAQSWHMESPIFINVNNATAASTIDAGAGIYAP